MDGFLPQLSNKRIQEPDSCSLEIRDIACHDRQVGNEGDGGNLPVDGLWGESDLTFPQTWEESASNARIRSPKSLISIPSQPSRRRPWERAPRLRINSRPCRNFPTAWTGRNIVSSRDLCQNLRTPASALSHVLASLMTMVSIRDTLSHSDDSCQSPSQGRHRAWRRDPPRWTGAFDAGGPPFRISLRSASALRPWDKALSLSAFAMSSSTFLTMRLVGRGLFS